jgi:hypothetical protein
VSGLQEQIEIFHDVGALGRYANEYQARRHANAVKLLIITEPYGRTRLTYEGWEGEHFEGRVLCFLALTVASIGL